ncbi:MAG: glycosyltransferase family 9 protein [Candidatus Omnitrophica bacterium]|nr:glycosyltransferase family 9 protein [Candidatus Omnitrophota bacterium]
MMDLPRILIVRTDRIGDVILSTPVIRALRAAFPDAYLGMMVRPANRELIEGNPDLDAVILFDKDGPQKSGRGTLRFAGELRKHRFDTALILHSTNRVILLAWLAGIRRRIGYARRLRWLLTDPVPYIKREGDRHELEYNLDLLRRIGVESKERTLSVPVRPEQEQKVGIFLEAHGISNGSGSLIAVHPGASCPSKRWPADRFAQVADGLAGRYQARIIVVTGPEEVQFGEQVVGRMAHPALRALGTLSLGEMGALLKRARCLVSNDSGPVHLACAVGTPVVSIFGRWGGGLSPTRWGPTGPKSIALHHDVGCRPCLAHRCPIGFICLEAVTVEEVLAAVGHVAGLTQKKQTA